MVGNLVGESVRKPLAGDLEAEAAAAAERARASGLAPPWPKPRLEPIVGTPFLAEGKLALAALAYEKAGGRRAVAARILGVSSRRLRGWLGGGRVDPEAVLTSAREWLARHLLYRTDGREERAEELLGLAEGRLRAWLPGPAGRVEVSAIKVAAKAREEKRPPPPEAAEPETGPLFYLSIAREKPYWPQAERQLVEGALSRSGGKAARAARLLGCHRAWIGRRLARWRADDREAAESAREAEAGRGTVDERLDRASKEELLWVLNVSTDERVRFQAAKRALGSLWRWPLARPPRPPGPAGKPDEEKIPSGAAAFRDEARPPARP